LVLLVPVGEPEEYGGYWLYILPLLELIILPELIITQGPSKHHSRLWKLTPETLILVRVIMPLVLLEPKVLQLDLRSILIFSFLFLHNEPVLGII
jgi:hypothetical protein